MHRLKPNFKAPDVFALTEQQVPRYTLVVQGRFHAFALAKSLLALDMPVHVVTNYPAFIAERFGLPRSCVTGCAPLGLLHRYIYRFNLAGRDSWIERFIHQSFSHWAARKIRQNPTDVLHAFSGIATEIYNSLDGTNQKPLRILARGSAHIRYQYQVLQAESERARASIDLPSQWMMEREEGEYHRSDHILTLSSFARQSFIDKGYSEEKLLMLPLGSSTTQFRPSRQVLDARLNRLHSGSPLRVLGTGTFCLRKGAIDFVEVARALQGRATFTWVGNIGPDSQHLRQEANDLVHFHPRVPEADLHRHYHDHDIYLFPTVEDGFAVTLAQAKAACLPIIATDHCAAPDMVVNGENGWIIPIRQGAAMIDKLSDLNEDRQLPASMVENLWQRCDTRDWPDVGKDFLKLTAVALKIRASATSAPPSKSL